LKIIQISDLHLSAGDNPDADTGCQRLLACGQWITRHHDDAELCIVTGDLVDDGSAEGYTVLRDCLAEFGMPVRLLMGNHDRRAPFKSVFSPDRIHDDKFVQERIHGTLAELILLDTLDEGETAGFLCSDRLAFLEDSLGQAIRDRPVLIFMHHPPIEVGFPFVDSVRLSNSSAFWGILTQQVRPTYVFCGHIHSTVHVLHGSTPVVTQRGLAHRFMASSAAARPVIDNAPPSIGVIKVSHDKTVAVTSQVFEWPGTWSRAIPHA
jgi:3',5'-cyclic-AMP phosphodiesterase